jgi:hypothetical protein
VHAYPIRLNDCEPTVQGLARQHRLGTGEQNLDLGKGSAMRSQHDDCGRRLGRKPQWIGEIKI